MVISLNSLRFVAVEMVKCACDLTAVHPSQYSDACVVSQLILPTMFASEMHILVIVGPIQDLHYMHSLMYTRMHSHTHMHRPSPGGP